MSDLGRNQDSNTVRLIGNDSDGNETFPIKSSSNNELSIRDTHDNGGLDAKLNLDDINAVEGKVGALTKTERKFILMEALSTNVIWGFSSSSQSFDLFKSQLLMVPVGPNTEVWFKMRTGTGQVAFGELS